MSNNFENLESAVIKVLSDYETFKDESSFSKLEIQYKYNGRIITQSFDKNPKALRILKKVGILNPLRNCEYCILRPNKKTITYTPLKITVKFPKDCTDDTMDEADIILEKLFKLNTFFHFKNVQSVVPRYQILSFTMAGIQILDVADVNIPELSYQKHVDELTLDHFEGNLARCHEKLFIQDFLVDKDKCKIEFKGDKSSETCKPVYDLSDGFDYIRDLFQKKTQ